MRTILESSKTKLARRVIEIFEFFDGETQTARAADIVRRYGHPASSTAELLTSLVEMGLLYKDTRSRLYSPTPRLAALGGAAQPEIIRDGRLFAFADRFARTSRYGIALFGMVGTHVQMFRWTPGGTASSAAFGCGASERLAASTAGLLIISTLPADQGRRLLWRLNAEAPAEEKFSPSEMAARVAEYGRKGHATGPAGFSPDTQVTAVLLPFRDDGRPLALGAIHPAHATVDADALVASLTRGIDQCLSPEERGQITDLGPRAIAV